MKRARSSCLGKSFVSISNVTSSNPIKTSQTQLLWEKRSLSYQYLKYPVNIPCATCNLAAVKGTTPDNCSMKSNRFKRLYSSSSTSIVPEEVKPISKTQEKLNKILEMAERIFENESSSAAVEFLEKQYKLFPHIRILERQAHYLIAKAHILNMLPFIKEYRKKLDRADAVTLPSPNDFVDKDLKSIAEKVQVLSGKSHSPRKRQPLLQSTNTPNSIPQIEGTEGMSESKIHETSSSSNINIDTPPEINLEKVDMYIEEHDIGEQRPEQILEEAVYLLKKVRASLEEKNRLTLKRDLRLNSLLAEVLHELNNFKEAEQVLKQLRDRHLEEVKTFENLGNLYLRESFKLEDWIREIQAGETIVSQTSMRNDTSIESLAIKRSNMLLHAIQTFTRGLQVDKRSIKCLSGRGRVFQILGQYEKAIEDYSAVIGEDPNHWTTYSLRGDCFFELGKWFQAQSDMKFLLDNFEDWSSSQWQELHYTDPETTLQHLLLRLAYTNMQLKEKASPAITAIYLDHIIASNRTATSEERKTTATALSLRSKLYYDKKDYKKCIDDCTRAINLDNRIADSFKWRAQALQQLGQQDQAKEDTLKYYMLLGK